MPTVTTPAADRETATRGASIVLPCALLFGAMLNLTLVVPGLKELVIDDLGGDVGDAALFFTVEMVAYLFAAPLWGLASDRLGRRRPFLVLGFLGSAAIYASYLAVDSIAALLALRFVQGALSVAGWSTAMAVVADRAEGPGRARAMGMAGASIILGVGLGAPIGGVLTGALGPRAPLAAAAGLFALLGLASLALHEPPRHGVHTTVRAILSALTARPALLLPWGFYFVERFTVGLFVVVFPLYLEAATGGGPAARGRMLGLFLLPFALLQPITYRLADRFGARRSMAAGALVYGAAMTAVGLLPHGVLTLWMVLLGGAAAVMFPPTLALTAALSGPESKATAMAGFNLAGSVGFALGPVAGAWARGAWGFEGAFLLAGSLAVVASVATLAMRLRD